MKHFFQIEIKNFLYKVGLYFLSCNLLIGVQIWKNYRSLSMQNYDNPSKNMKDNFTKANRYVLSEWHKYTNYREAIISIKLNDNIG